jgi:hypothetical protein
MQDTALVYGTYCTCACDNEEWSNRRSRPSYLSAEAHMVRVRVRVRYGARMRPLLPDSLVISTAVLWAFVRCRGRRRTRKIANACAVVNGQV